MTEMWWEIRQVELGCKESSVPLHSQERIVHRGVVGSGLYYKKIFLGAVRE